MTPTRLEARHRVAVILREARVGARLTQQHIAEALGVGRRTVLGWERGESEPPASLAVDWLALCGKPASTLDEMASRIGRPADPNEWWVGPVRSRCSSPGAQPQLPFPLPGFDGGVFVAAAPPPAAPVIDLTRTMVVAA